MNDETTATNTDEVDDTEGHAYREGANLAEATEAHAYRGGVRPADEGDADDTEGNCFKYRDDGPAGRPDDTDGHTANARRLPRGDDSNGRGKKAPG